MADNIDNLLDDLDALITNKPPPSSNNHPGIDSSLPYRTPHRPSNEKSPTQLNNPNPKNKFAIEPTSTHHSYNHQQHHHHQQQQQHQGGFRSENVRNQNYQASSASSSASSSSGKKDMESIDSLLELWDDSPTKQQAPSSFQSSYNTASTKQPSNTSYTSPYSSSASSSHTSNRGSSSSTSSSFPTFDRSSDTGSASYSSKRQDSSHYSASNGNGNGNGSSTSDDDCFDSLLSDINSSLPPVSPNTKQSDAPLYTPPPSSSSASLLQPPTQSAAKGGRCSRVVIAGSAMARGAKTSAFSKSACDRLRCLKCNFEAIQFSGKAWTSAVDYMFFRNNMPNKLKLAAELVTKPASVAYCCQCSWISTEEEETLSAGQSDKPQWVCAGH